MPALRPTTLAALFISPAATSPLLAQCEQLLPFSGAATPGPSGSVVTVCDWDPDGPGPLPPWLIAGGSFASAGAAPASNVAAWDGQAWRALGAGVNGSVSVVAPWNSGLVVAGAFLSAGGDPASRVALWDGAAWHSLGAGIGGSSPSVSALAVYNGHLIAAGTFPSAGGVPAVNIAEFDGSQWHALGAGLNGAVRALALYNNDLYAAGSFGASGATSLPGGLARWNGTSWSPLAGVTSGSINAFALWNGRLAMGGSVQFSGTGAAVAVWDGASLASLPILPSGGGPTLLANWGGTLVAVGNYTQSQVILFNGSTWESTTYPFTNASISVLATHAGQLVTHASSISTGRNLVHYDGLFVGSFGSGPTDAPAAVAEYQGDLYAAGPFWSGDGIMFRDVARWDGSRWNRVGGGASNRPRCLVVYNNELIAASIVEAGGVQVNGVGRWDGAAWHPLGGQPVYSANTLAVLAGQLYLAGSVGSTNQQIGVWNGSTWDFFPAIPNTLTGALALFRGDLIVAGSISPGTGNAPYIARWDGAGWQPLGDGLGGFNAQVRTIVVYNDSLYAIGSFTRSGSLPLSGMARWDGTTWSAAGNPDGTVTDLAVYNGALYATGAFTHIGGVAASRLARFDGIAWSPVGAGFTQDGYRLFPLANQLLVTGGFIPILNGLASPHAVRYACPPPPPCYANCDGSTVPPILNVNDFVCFQSQFAASNPAANCDGSTTPPILNVNDFICFQAAFAHGCP